MPRYFDTHAHYFSEKFDTLEGGAEALLSSPDFQDAVCGVVNVGTNLCNSKTAIDMAKKYDFMYAAVGIHPEDAQGLPDGTPLDLDSTLSGLWDMLSDSQKRKERKIVAVGEIGLDYHWQPMDKPLQKTFFAGQLEIAQKLDLPVIIHDREAHGDVFDILLSYPQIRGVFHCYSGSAEMAKDLVRRGWYIAFGGAVTYKNAIRVREAAAAVPLERLLIETDAPYMAPEPFRYKKICHSGMLAHVVDVLSQIHGITHEAFADLTEKNARKVFDL